MHVYEISQKELASKIGWTNVYLSSILAGKRKTQEAEYIIKTALNELAGERYVEKEGTIGV